MFYTDLDRVGPEGEGFKLILHGLNPERILEAANLMVMKAATLFDRGQECGVEANTGKYLAGEYAFEACHTAMLTLGARDMRRSTM